ncbi:integrator complex subunit 9-like [Centruroides sculpturatus]|uniref:integrator complex subunit 9-like n=1 Tax=Centruroides sculpturatus TaxID=218467 RepID=UPI000C6D1945|nr:integrator complex subunit 9-like [Centruroides sculpturatus]
MKLYCLSGHPNKSCNVLKFKNTTIMLDCGLDAMSVLHFLPLPLIPSSRLANLSTWIPRNSNDAQLEGELRECAGRVFIDSSPEFCLPEVGIIDFSEIDVILLSNYQSMMALPYITEGGGFNGTVYATEPTLQIGKQFMEELVNYIERTPKIKVAKKWKQPEILKTLPPPFDSIKPRTWRQIYTMKEVNSSLAKVKVVGYAEKLDIYGVLNVSAVSSGYCLGSCNWIISSNHEKITYISGSSTLTTHPKPMEHTPLRNSDVLIMSSLTQTPLANPDNMLGELCITIELHLWLSQSKQSKVYLPEEPFPHAQLIRNGRLKHFPSICVENFSTEFRTPCIVFAGHPSLRFGDAVHFMELWGGSSNNIVVFTEPDFPYLEAVAPFQPLSMKVAHYPIDTSLSFNQANKLIRDLKPTHLIVPEQYIVPPPLQHHRTDLALEREFPIISYKRGDVLQIPIKRRYERLYMDAELAASLMPTEVKPGVAMMTVTGLLTVKNNKYILKPLIQSNQSKKRKNEEEYGYPSNYAWGTLDVPHFSQKLTKAGFADVKLEESPNGYIVHMQHEDTLIQVEDHSTHIICQGDSTIRTRLRDLLLQCLKKF